jgi:hypothetical protein
MYAPIISPTDRPPKLRVELVPQTCWLSDVKSYMTAHYWSKLSREVAEDGGIRCEVCSGRGRQHPVECHEVWLYDNERCLQTLLRLQALCPMCHRVKHLDQAISNGYGEQACERLARVNGWDAATTRWYVSAVAEQWRARSQMHLGTRSDGALRGVRGGLGDAQPVELRVNRTRALPALHGPSHDRPQAASVGKLGTTGVMAFARIARRGEAIDSPLAGCVSPRAQVRDSRTGSRQDLRRRRPVLGL